MGYSRLLVMRRIAGKLDPETEGASEGKKLRRQEVGLKEGVALLEAEVERTGLNAGKPDDCQKSLAMLCEELYGIRDLEGKRRKVLAGHKVVGARVLVYGGVATRVRGTSLSAPIESVRLERERRGEGIDIECLARDAKNAAHA